jgi:hypothetical protein
MGINIDIGDEQDIHPKNKQEVGRRLSLWALGTVYGQQVARDVRAALPAGHEVRGREIVLKLHDQSPRVPQPGDRLHCGLAAPLPMKLPTPRQPCFHGADLVNAGKTRRVGLIGAGWYGKSDLWRLVQVAPSRSCPSATPTPKMLAGAVEIASQRQKSKKAPRTYRDYREMLKEKDLDIVSSARPTTGTRSRPSPPSRPAPMSTSRSPSAWMCSKARPSSPPRGNTSASSRSAPSARARRT